MLFFNIFDKINMVIIMKKINSKGFTLIELLCVITLLSLLTIIATTSIMNLSKKSKENLYCAKIELIKSAASDYALKYISSINESTTYYEGYKSIKIKANDLIKANKIEAAKDGNLLNPIDNASLNELEIILYLNNNKINIYIDTNNIC